MSGLALGTILKAAIIAGLLAGLTVAVFHLVVTEPLVEQAIAMEERRADAAHAHKEPIVGRRVQKGGLVLGYLLYGLTWALPFGVTYQLAQRRLPTNSRVTHGLLLAFLAYWSVCLLPSLKYPANPPGVGDPATIGYRQGLYLGFLTLSVVATVLSVGLGRSAARARGPRRGPWIPVGVCLLLLSAAVYAVMPSNPDQVAMPADVVGDFRILSFAGLTLFWAVLGFLFGKLLSQAPAVA